MSVRTTVRGTILRNRPYFQGRDDDGDAVSGRVRFSRPLSVPDRTGTHYRVRIELDDGRVARGYWGGERVSSFTARREEERP